jgi:hypothetical protein
VPVRNSFAAFLVILLLLPGCGARGDYPSLAPRPIEKETAAEPAPAAAPVIPNDAQLAAQLADLLASARKGQAAFEAAREAASASAAHAGAAGSDAWAEAQQALSRLDAARSPSVIALADLDGLAPARGKAGTATSDEDLAAIAAAAEEVRAMVEGQQAEIDRLSGSLNPL